MTNVWSMAISALTEGTPRFGYALTRSAPRSRDFRVEFDLARPVTPPPAPWGH